MRTQVLRPKVSSGMAASPPSRYPWMDPKRVPSRGEEDQRNRPYPLDVDILREMAKVAGLFVEYHILFEDLLAKYRELEKAKRKAEDSERFKSRIITITSHELRTPLTVIDGYVSALLLLPGQDE